MVGNVTGVSLLETVGVPAPSIGPGGTPGQNFAAVMQQAGDEAGTALPLSNAADSTAKTKDEGARMEAAIGQADGAKAKQGGDVLAQATRQAKAGSSIGAKLIGAGPNKNLVMNAQASDTVVALPDLRQGTGAKQGIVAANLVLDGNATATVPNALVAKATSTELAAVVDASGTGVTGVPMKGSVAADVSLQQPVAVQMQQPVAVQKRDSKATVSLDSKPAEKTAESKADSKLTAMIPQATATVPQSEALTLTQNAASTLVAPATATPVESASGKDAMSGHSDTLADGAALAAGVPAATGRRMAPQALSSAVVGSDSAVAPVQSASITTATPVSGFNTEMNLAVASAGLANGVKGRQTTDTNTNSAAVPLANAVSAQQADGVTASSMQAAQSASALQTGTGKASGEPLVATGATLAASAVKPIATPVRSGLTSVKNGGEVAAQAATSGPSAPTAVPTGAPTLQPTGQASKPVAEPGVSAAVGVNAVAKPGDTVPLLVRPVTSPSKTASPQESTPAPVGSKEAASQAAVAPATVSTASADHSSVVVPVVVPVSSLPHAPAPTVTAPSGNSLAVSVTTVHSGITADAGLSHTTLSSTPTSLEVGVSSGTHGWLKIRAELNAAGEVNASLTGTSTATAEKLRGDLPALSSYLQAEKVPMGVLDVRSAVHAATASFDGGSTFSQTGQGQPGSSQPGHSQTGQGSANGTPVSADTGASGGRAQQQAQQDTTALSGVDGIGVVSDKVLPGRITDTAVYGIHTELDGSEGSPSVGYGAGGGWLNVRA